MAGDYPAAEASSREALAAAREVGHEPLIAEASHRLGRDLGWRGQYPESERALREAYFVAAQVGDHRTAFEAADSLIFVVGDAQGRYDDALDWARHAQEELEHLPPDAATQGRLLHSMGLALARHGDVEESLDYLQRAVDVMADDWGHDDPRLGIPYNNLANSLMAAGRLEEAQDAYAFAYELTIERYGPEHPQAAVSLGNLGDVLMRRGDADAAVELLEECLAIVRGALRPEHLHVADTEYRLGKVLRAAGRNEDAIAHLEIAQAAFAELEGYADFTHPLLELGLARLAIGRPRDAASVLNRAIAVAGDKAGAETMADLQFAAARAVWAIGEEPRRARGLAAQARQARASAGLDSDEIDRWLSERARSG